METLRIDAKYVDQVKTRLFFWFIAVREYLLELDQPFHRFYSFTHQNFESELELS